MAVVRSLQLLFVVASCWSLCVAVRCLLLFVVCYLLIVGRAVVRCCCSLHAVGNVSLFVV